MFVFLFSLVLESDDDETDEDINHEKGYDNDVDDEVDGDVWAMIEQWTVIFHV